MFVVCCQCVVDRCLLFVICFSLLVVCRLVSVDCLLLVVCCLLLAVCVLLVDRCESPVVLLLDFIVVCRSSLSLAHRSLFVVCCLYTD